MIIDETFFHKGAEIKELADSLYFPSNGKNLMCYTESFYDTMTLVLDPIREYVRQVDELKSSHREDRGQTLDDMILILYALERNARMSFEKWLEDFEKHLGYPRIRYISQGSGGDIDDLKAETPVGVEIIRYDS